MHHRMVRDREALSLATVLGRGGLILLAAVMVSALAGGLAGDPPAPAARAAQPLVTPSSEVVALRMDLEVAENALAVERLKNRRADAVAAFSGQYGIPADLAASVYDHAITEGIAPTLAFKLVKVESNFTAGARSRAMAIGYTQLKLATAQHYEPWVTERDLRTPDVNLRIGFRFLRDLMRRYGGDEELALLAYNRGPARVNEYLDSGVDPDNGYPAAILRAGQ